MRGFFGIGVERVSKSMNVGSLFRSAHAFGASFVFTVDAVYQRDQGALADTSDAPGHVPFYDFPDVDGLVLPKGCELVGVELLDDSIELPSFRHPRAAAYVMGPERGELSPEMQARCSYTVQIPTKFSLNVGLAGALVMYDRLISLGKFPRRPMMPGGELETIPETVFGDPVLRQQAEKYRASPPASGDVED